MYADQVIEDIKKVIKQTYPNDNIYRKTLRAIVPDIINAQHFHLGKYSVIQAPFKSQFKKTRIFLDDVEYLRMPYNLCWLDFDMDFRTKQIPLNTSRFIKGGLLITSLKEDLLYLRLFECNENGSWRMLKVVFFFSVGKKLNEIDHYKEIILSIRYLDIPNDIFSFYEDRNFLIWPLNIDVAELPPSLILEDCRTNFQVAHWFGALMNCKNIVTEKIRPTVSSKRKRLKMGKPPLFSYHILKVIIGEKKLKRFLQNSGTTESHNRQHLQRGHWKYYPPPGLFNKYPGLFYWHDHMRGQGEGFIDKDYVVEVRDGR